MISVAQPSTFKWHFHFSSNFIDFLIFHTCACLFWVITTTWGCHPPPSTGHLSLHHLLALCHAHPTLPSPWATPRSILVCAHTHACLIGAPSTHFPVDFHRLPVHNGWGAIIIPTGWGPYCLHCMPTPLQPLLPILYWH